MIFYGRKASKIGAFNIKNFICQYCEKSETQQISVFGTYAHVYWIPLFPLGTEAVSECEHCKRTISQKEFSNQLMNRYHALKGAVKRPFWHWTGLAVIGIIIGLAILVSAFAEEDPRRELLQADVKQMTKNPTMESDSVAYILKSFIGDFVNEELKPSTFEYLTKVNGNKALILTKIPTLKKVKKEERKQVIETIELVVNAQETLKDMDKYIGIQGKFNMMMIKTPSDFQNSRLALDDPLFEFYGPKPEKKI